VKGLEGLEILGKALGMGLAIGLGAIGTGIAQGGIGAAAAGAIAEKPELMGRMLFILVIPELLVILGFAMALIIFSVL